MTSQLVKLRHIIPRCSFNVLQAYSRRLDHKFAYCCRPLTSSSLYKIDSIHDLRVLKPATLTLHYAGVLVQQTRSKKRRRNRAAYTPPKKRQTGETEEEESDTYEEDEETDDDDDDDIDSDKKADRTHFERHFPEDIDLPSNYKEEKIFIPNGRVDKVCMKALRMKKDFQDTFLGGKIQRNRKKVLKKSVPVEEGDAIDVQAGVDPDGKTLYKRVRIVKMIRSTTKDTLYVRVWRTPTTIS